WAIIALDVNQAHPASGSWLQFVIITERGNIQNAMVHCRAQDRLPLIGAHGLAVNGEHEGWLAHLIALEGLLLCRGIFSTNLYCHLFLQRERREDLPLTGHVFCYSDEHEPARRCQLGSDAPQYGRGNRPQSSASPSPGHWAHVHQSH